MASHDIEPTLTLLFVLVIIALFIEGLLSPATLVVTLGVLVFAVWLLRGLTVDL